MFLQVDAAEVGEQFCRRVYFVTNGLADMQAVTAAKKYASSFYLLRVLSLSVALLLATRQ